MGAHKLLQTMNLFIGRLISSRAVVTYECLPYGESYRSLDELDLSVLSAEVSEDDEQRDHFDVCLLVRARNQSESEREVTNRFGLVDAQGEVWFSANRWWAPAGVGAHHPLPPFSSLSPGGAVVGTLSIPVSRRRALDSVSGKILLYPAVIAVRPGSCGACPGYEELTTLARWEPLSFEPSFSPTKTLSTAGGWSS